MKTIEVEIKNKAGLHARPSSLFVQVASNFDSEIKVKYEDEEINGKSIMGLMLLAAEQGAVLTLTANGDDEDDLLAALKELIEDKKFGEE
ncbi:HPr family phosphocarrier protein [Fusobacterium perfoetens]|uniref:HPr family phosphocarrier protein n=1 Tax=Fusobacterium perfoetens TaxID=852 RepID=UPI001F3EAED8|nr:HPr family phosphocarrier protein [Fusobacterium perfoetens]MCF2611718.1 HPr family phosphocarrier protein [Fusobacterium perfoetens]